MSIKSDIESYTGALSGGSLDALLRRSIAYVVDLVPPALLSPYVTMLNNIGAGASIKDKKVFAVGDNARQVLETEAQRYMDAGSIYYVSSVRDQIYWLSNQMIYSLPDDADVVVIDYSHASEYDTNIACLPPQFTQAVVLDVAINLLQAQLALRSHTAFTLNAKSKEALGAFSDYGYGGLYEELYSGHSDSISLVYPGRVPEIILEWTDLSEITGWWDSDIKSEVDDAQAELNDINDAIVAELGEGLTPTGNEDLEKGIAHVQHLDARVKAYVQKVDVLLKKILANSEIEKTNRFKQLERTIEAARNELARFEHSLSLFISHGQLLIAEHKANTEREAQTLLLIQMLSARFSSYFAPLMMEKSK